MIDLVGKVVEVLANNTVYTGVLVEMGEQDVYIESETGFIVIPTEQIASIREKDRR
ncbi:MAG TPA: hypothetical protein VMH06_00180 [Thermodesulfovibrionales bacterium]|nr:hypothetical protein [Thermodesulfovibrionales bacterium]